MFEFGNSWFTADLLDDGLEGGVHSFEFWRETRSSFECRYHAYYHVYQLLFFWRSSSKSRNHSLSFEENNLQNLFLGP